MLDEIWIGESRWGEFRLEMMVFGVRRLFVKSKNFVCFWVLSKVLINIRIFGSFVDFFCVAFIVFFFCAFVGLLVFLGVL